VPRGKLQMPSYKSSPASSVDCPVSTSLDFRQKDIGGAKLCALHPAAAYRLPDCRWSAPETYIGAWDITGSV